MHQTISNMSQNWLVTKWNPDVLETNILTQTKSKQSAQLAAEDYLFSVVMDHDGIDRMNQPVFIDKNYLKKMESELDTSRHFICPRMDKNGWRMALYKISVTWVPSCETYETEEAFTEEYQEPCQVEVEKPVLVHGWFGTRTEIQTVMETVYQTKLRSVMRKVMTPTTVIKKVSQIKHLFTLKCCLSNTTSDTYYDTRDCKEAVEFFISHLDKTNAMELVQLWQDRCASFSQMRKEYPDLFSNHIAFDKLYHPKYVPPLLDFIETPTIVTKTIKPSYVSPKPVQLTGLGHLNDDILKRRAEMFAKKKHEELKSPEGLLESDCSDSDDWSSSSSEEYDSISEDESESSEEYDLPEIPNIPVNTTDALDKLLDSLMEEMQNNPLQEHVRIQTSMDLIPRYELHPKFKK